MKHKQDINPIIQRETATHHPATSVDAILTIMLRAEQGDLIAQHELFADMEERDAHIYAEITKRKIAISQLDWTLAAASDAGAREKKELAKIEQVIRDIIDIDTLVFDMADAIGHGFSALEIKWQRDSTTDWWLPISIQHRPQRWFTVDQETYREIRLRNGQSLDGEPLVPYGWILHQHSSKTGYPATQGLYRTLMLPYLFKNFAVKNWLRFSELYGIPIRALFSSIKDKTERNNLLKSLQAMGSSGVAILDGVLGEDLKTVDVTKGEGQGFLNLIEWCERTVSKAILGGTLTSDTGKNGNYATAMVHNDVRQQIRDNDARQIAETLTNQLIGAIVHLNGLNIRARWAFDTQEPEDLKLYAESIPKLVEIGAQIPVSYIHDKLKIPEPEAGEPVLAIAAQQAPMQPQFSATLGAEQATFTPDQQAIENLADNMPLKSPIDSQAIRAAIRAATSPEDLEARLAVVLKDADLTEFKTQLERALFAADIMGYAHAE